MYTVVKRVAEGCSPAECCQDSFVNGYFECLTCVGTAENITDYGPAQQVVDQLTVQCNTEGFESPKLTLPGIDPNRTLPSSVPPLLTGTVPPTATNQETLTALPTITPATSPSGTAPPATTSSPSSAIPNHFFTPQLSHLSAYVVCSIILVHFVG
ncbi:hypothetical protein Agabi119p4_5173 [Agaricus bisporus var. burnettii]|uniref:Uncharacterized protein n=1 Tax=Agaricus bisporus var. burnettii TaxID=192524 RepID=A0A8H7F4L7_AGABI|nr:hypothetical protein Agabi119p4_5173 [Agaricus bisporus var. burnettii]